MSHDKSQGEEPAGSLPFKPFTTILAQEREQACAELSRPAQGLFLSGLTSGLTVGLGPLLGLAVETLYAEHDAPGAMLLRAHVYSLGFVLAILARTDLFTEYTTITLLPLLDRQTTLARVARLWGLVFAANLLGAAVSAGAGAVLAEEFEVLRRMPLSQFVRPMVTPSWHIILVSASLAGWLMGLLSWLLVASRETVSQLLFVYVTAFVLGVAHLHHIVTGSALVLMALFMGTAEGGELLHFALWTTLGNCLGGMLFAVLVRFSVLKRERGPAPER